MTPRSSSQHCSHPSSCIHKPCIFHYFKCRHISSNVPCHYSTNTVSHDCFAINLAPAVSSASSAITTSPWINLHDQFNSTNDFFPWLMTASIANTASPRLMSTPAIWWQQSRRKQHLKKESVSIQMLHVKRVEHHERIQCYLTGTHL